MILGLTRLRDGGQTLKSVAMRYIIQDCELDTVNLEFRAGGEIRHLEPQVFDLIRYLIEHPDRLITRQELIDEIWRGRIVSEAAIGSRINAARKALGDDGTRQAVIRTVPRRGVRFVAEVKRAAADETPTTSPSPHPEQRAAAPESPSELTQRLRFCRGHGGTRIAFGISGTGPTLVRVGHWLTHLEHDWHSPIWRPFLGRLGQSFTVVRYDQRGTGLSERDVADLSLDAFVADLEAVTTAPGLDPFALYATSQGVPVALEFAARHPDRLSCLVLHGGFYRGRLMRSPEEREEGEAYLTLMRHGWAKDGSQFLRAFASIFAPDATPEQVRSLVDLQRISADRDTAVRLREAYDRLDVTRRLSGIETPTLVIHARSDGIHPLSQSLEMAAALPNAELAVLESRNHVMLENDPAWDEFFAALTRFARSGFTTRSRDTPTGDPDLDGSSAP